MSALTILNSPAKEVLLVKLNMETQKECYYVISDGMDRKFVPAGVQYRTN
ncbi:MAG: hypothetical protein IPN29_06040 [Saprospiraceae bacterium]|nr:hypothetical protein [Saprospiraceae bacterium]